MADLKKFFAYTTAICFGLLVSSGVVSANTDKTSNPQKLFLEKSTYSQKNFVDSNEKAVNGPWNDNHGSHGSHGSHTSHTSSRY